MGLHPGHSICLGGGEEVTNAWSLLNEPMRCPLTIIKTEPWEICRTLEHLEKLCSDLVWFLPSLGENHPQRWHSIHPHATSPQHGPSMDKLPTEAFFGKYSPVSVLHAGLNGLSLKSRSVSAVRKLTTDFFFFLYSKEWGTMKKENGTFIKDHLIVGVPAGFVETGS